MDARVKEKLLEAGLGEAKITVPDIDDCGASEFKDILLKQYPKLGDGGGFELLRCVSNTRSLEVISTTVSRVPRLLKSVIGCGKVFIRPIQKDLSMSPDTALESADIEVIKLLIRWFVRTFIPCRKWSCVLVATPKFLSVT